MNKLRTIFNHPNSITDIRTFLILSVCILSVALGLFFGGANDADVSTRTDYNHSINYSHGVYTLTGGTNLTLDDEYSNDSESRKTYDTYRPAAGNIPLFALTHLFSHSEVFSRNIFHYDTYFGFIPLRSPPQLS